MKTRPDSAPPDRRSVLKYGAAAAGALILPGCEWDPLLRIESITFNHDPGSSAGSALNIRRNATERVPIPEWTPASGGPASSPAAYSLEHARKTPPRILVALSALGPSRGGERRPFDGRLEVLASGGGLLGRIDPITVTFEEGIPVSGPVSIPLVHHRIGSGGTRGVERQDIRWDWQYRLPGSSRTLPTHATRHRVYVVLREPQGPWTQTPFPDPHNPWAEALDRACELGAGNGEEDPFDDVASAVAWMLNPGGEGTAVARLRYDVERKESHFTPGGRFDLTGILRQWRAPEADALVDCQDCASLHSTLANLLGCDLWQQRIDTQAINPVMPIGYGRWWVPTTGFVPASGPVTPEPLLFHEVSCKGTGLGRPIWDICYIVNGFPDPTRPERPHPSARRIFYAYGVPFSDSGALDYREMLHSDDPARGTVEMCVPGGGPFRRRLV